MPLDETIESILASREDVSGITIDTPAAKRLDDGFHLEKTDSGFILHISIADVGAVIGADREIEQKAYVQELTQLKPGTPISLPGSKLSDAVSLTADGKKPALTISISIDEHFNLSIVSIKKTAFESTAGLTYEQADAKMADGTLPILKEAYELSEQLLGIRKAEGALAIFNNEAGFIATEEGSVILLDPSERYQSRLIVQEFMILTNQALAEYFAENNIPGLYRNHRRKLCAPSNREILRDMELIVTEKDLGKIRIFDKRLNLITERAAYSTIIHGHFGLGVAAYMHFTSPIRRHADLVNVLQLSAVLDGVMLPYSVEQLNNIADHLNGIENQSNMEQNKRAAPLNKVRTLKDYDILSGLDKKLFSKVIKVSVTNSRFHPKLDNEIQRRLKLDTLNCADFFYLLLGINKDDPLRSNLRQQAIAALIEKPSIVPSIFSYTRVKLNWPTPVFQISEERLNDKIFFYCLASITIGGTIYQSQRTMALTKKMAQRLSLADLLVSCLEIEKLYSDEARNTVIQVVAGDYAKAIYRLYQKKHLPLPVYEYKSDSKKTICTLRLNGFMDNLTEFTGHGPTRKTAKRAAAREAYQKFCENYPKEEETKERGVRI